VSPSGFACILVRVNFSRNIIVFVLIGLALLSGAFTDAQMGGQASAQVSAQVVRSSGALPNVRAQESRLATRQLIWPLDSQAAFLNGSPVSLALPIRVVSGRTMVPLREIVRVLGLNLEAVPNMADGLRLGRLDLYPSLKLARLEGKQLPLSEVAGVLDGSLYVAVRMLEVALNAGVSVDSLQRLLTITVSRDRLTGPRLPVARFTTDKREYRIGEPVVITEYSYDPDGMPIASLSYAGREEAYFVAGLKTISLVATNRLGRASEPFSVQVRVTTEVLFSAREYAQRFTPIGKTFADNLVLSYPVINPNLDDFTSTLLVSDSPEEPTTSGLLLAETILGEARLVAYHTNATPGPGKVLVLVTNLESDPVSVNLRRFGETTATSIVAMLGQVSLLDFLTDTRLDTLRLEPGATAALYQSPSFTPGHGINTMMDLETNGQVLVETYFLEDRVRETLGDLRSGAALEGLRDLPVLPADANHVRGSFPNAVRQYRVDLSGLAVGAGARLVVGDGVFDPALQGHDALSDRFMTLLGNFGATYKIIFENTQGVLVAFVPRGGPYAGAVRINGGYQPLPDSGVLYRNDLPLVLYRSLDTNRAVARNANARWTNRLELEFVPASGSFLPVNFLLYRLEARNPLQAKGVGTK
jgi:hypothetical protein